MIMSRLIDTFRFPVSCVMMSAMVSLPDAGSPAIRYVLILFPITPQRGGVGSFLLYVKVNTS